MARRTRRRKPRVVWLPTFGHATSAFGEVVGGAAGISGQLNFDTDEVIYDAFPVTFDQSVDPAQAQAQQPVGGIYVPNLQDLVSGNEYRLRRIVGKIFIGVTSDETDDPAQQSALADVAVGFIVARTDDDGAPTTDFTEVNPLQHQSMEDPWIWRRRWILNPYGNVRQADLANNALDLPGFHMYPSTNAGYGSASDGPHIDQKTARVIHHQERLYCIVAVRQWTWGGDQQNAGMQLSYLLDYRLLASLRPGSSGNRRNASR